MVAELLFSSSVEFLTRQLCGVPILGLVSVVPVDDEIEPFRFPFRLIVQLFLEQRPQQDYEESYEQKPSVVSKFLHNY